MAAPTLHMTHETGGVGMRRFAVWSMITWLLASGAPAWAADDFSGNTQSKPQGPAKTSDASTAPGGIVGYTPIPNSMLPIGDEQPASAANPGAQKTPPTVPTNLGGLTVGQTGPYALGRNDVVQIDVQGQPDFSGTYVINYDGTIQYGFVGDVKADGLTKEELAAKLTEELKKYVRVPVVNVQIAGFNSKAIYILGEVSSPGKYAMRGDSIKIRDALIAAGLFTNTAALARVHIIKSDINDPTVRVLNLNSVLFRGQMKNDIDLVDGDIVVVPSTVWSRVTGFLGTLFSPASKARSVARLGTL